MNIRDILPELVKCPNCGNFITTEYLTSITTTGEVVGCSSCIRPRPKLKVLHFPKEDER